MSNRRQSAQSCPFVCQQVQHHTTKHLCYIPYRFCQILWYPIYHAGLDIDLTTPFLNIFRLEKLNIFTILRSDIWQLNSLYRKRNIVRVIKSRRLRLAGHMARMEEGKSVFNILIGRLNLESRIHKGSPINPILSQINSIPRIYTYFFGQF